MNEKVQKTKKEKGIMQKTKAQKEPEVLVLLSTYNGEKYLWEQLDSILAQKGCQVKVLVRDDGSTDRSAQILQEYQQGKGKEKFLPVIWGKNVGVIKSFFELLYRAEKLPCGYYALADQDDIWQEDKLAAAVRAIEAEEKKDKVNKPQDKPEAYLYAGAVQPVNEQGKDIPEGIRYPKRRPGFGNALVENICTGCTCVMNRELLMLFCSVGKEREPRFAVMHDFWLYLLASAIGKVIYDEKSYIYYRQHKDNSIGMASTALESYKKRVQNFRKNRGRLRRQAAEFERLYGERLKRSDGEKARLLRDFAAGKKKLIFGGGLYRQRKSDQVIMKVLFGIGRL